MDTCVHGGDGCIGLTLPPLALALGSDFGTVVIRSPAPRLHAATAERREHTYANVHSSRLITEKTAARPGLQRGVVQNKGVRHSNTERDPGRQIVAAGAAAFGSGQICFISLGYTSSRGPLTFFALCCGASAAVPASHSPLVQRWNRTRARKQPRSFPATASSCGAFPHAPLSLPVRFHCPVSSVQIWA